MEYGKSRQCTFNLILVVWSVHRDLGSSTTIVGPLVACHVCEGKENSRRSNLQLGSRTGEAHWKSVYFHILQKLSTAFAIKLKQYSVNVKPTIPSSGPHTYQ